MNLLKAFSAVSGLTLLSRITGLVREMVALALFGAGYYMDAFNLAFRAPNLLRRLFAEGAFSQAFVPIFAEYKTKQGEEATRELLDRVSSLLATCVLAVTVLAIVFAPGVVYLLGAGFAATPGKVDTAALLVRIIFPYIFFISMTVVFSAALNNYGRFAPGAFAPVLLNIATIACAFLLSPHVDPPIAALAWGVFIGGVLQLGYLWQQLGSIAMRPRFRIDFRHPGVRRVMSLMTPALFGVSVSQVSMLINTQIASYLGNGAVTWLTSADRLMEFPSALLGVAAGTIILPSLVKHHANERPEEYSKLLDWGVRLTLILALPATVALAMIALPLIATLYMHGKFGLVDVLETRNALVAYSVGLLGLILLKVFAPAFYARQDIRTPVTVGLIALVATQAMNLAFVPHLRQAGLALATGLGACLNAGVLLALLLKRGYYRPQPGWGRFLFHCILALVAMLAVLWLGKGPDENWLHAGIARRVGHLTALVAAGGAAYFAVLFLLGVRPKDFARRET
jgi:putative peptidoglycan lipid II flippase